MTNSAKSTIHHLLVTGLLGTGRLPTLADLAATCGWSDGEVRSAIRQLEDDHGLVCHPGTEDVWVMPPFSLVPTAFWVQSEGRGWWASCIWCALGVCALAGSDATIHTRLAGESREVVLHVGANSVEPSGLVAHFPVPVARAWDNVHRFCGSTLVFESAEEVDAWCARHAIPRGDIQPLEKVLELAHAWYGDHAAPDWKKWSASEAAAIFASLGLDAETWALATGDGRF